MSWNPNKNRKNDRHRDYHRMNCMGYALGIKDWLVVGRYSKAVEYLQSEYNLTLVNKSEMVLGKRYIAFRYGSDDFHFMKRNEKGHWRHKMGNQKAISISQKNVFNKTGWDFDGLFYNSKVYLFVEE
jgi:hypothetical protein